MTQSNPPWATKLVKQYCDKIRSAADRLGLPMPAMDGKCQIDEELGTGHYGAVYQTKSHLADGTPVVFKVTSDESEAHFVATALKLAADRNIEPEGLVKYYAIFALPDSHRGRDTYILWREEAHQIGIPLYQRTYDIAEFDKYLMRFKHLAHEAKFIADKRAKKDPGTYWAWMGDQLSLADNMIAEYGEHWGEEKSVAQGWGMREDKVLNALMLRHKGKPDRFAWLVGCCDQVSLEMVNSNNAATEVGGALRTYLEEGILLADVHASNVGLVDRFNYSYVITDPGHAVILKQALSATEIPTL